MTTESKPESISRKRREEAGRFLWHFPAQGQTSLDQKNWWKARFDHDHWWKGKEDKVPMAAVVWEVLRRKPEAEAVHRSMHLAVDQGEFRAFIGSYGLSVWSKLSKWQKAGFIKLIEKHLPAQHGWSPRPVTLLNDRRPFKDHIGRLEKGARTTQLGELQKRLAHHLKTKTLEYHHAGQIIIAIDPNAQPRSICDSVEACVGNWQSDLKPLNSGKAHPGQWLDIIAKFEHEEFLRDQSKTIRDDQLFARYRRAIINFPWPSHSDGEVLP